MKGKTFIAILLLSFISLSSSAQKIKTGTWRGILTTSTQQEIPFNFTIKDTAGRQLMTIINGNERFKVTDVSTKGDSVFIKMPLFDSEFKLKQQGTTLTGGWVKHLGERDAITPFKATYGQNWRFFEVTTQVYTDIAGKWSAIFGEGAGRDTTVGVFQQKGNKVTGTFLTTTGDYRYLEGTVTGNKLYLSCFDGGHAFLFTADLTNDHTLINGQFFSGYSGKDVWTAIKNSNAALPDAYHLTGIKPDTKFGFSYPDLTGKKVSLSDTRFKNKVVIVEIMGSWCPNCMDQTAYLVNYYKKFHKRGVEVVDLAYERTTDFNKSRQSLLREVNHFNIPYPVLVTGYTSNKMETAKSLPSITRFMGFPTTLIIDKKGNVRKVYTGFSGPGTGNYYTEFVDGFERLTEELLAEK
jgi:thiol-disulfide isomerase/thioredoxin